MTWKKDTFGSGLRLAQRRAENTLHLFCATPQSNQNQYTSHCCRRGFRANALCTQLAIVVSLLFCVCNTTKASASTATLTLDPQQSEQDLCHAAFVLEDMHSSYSVDQVNSSSIAPRFQPAQPCDFNFGISPASYWIRLDVEGLAGDTAWILDIGRRDVQVDLYQETAQGWHFSRYDAYKSRLDTEQTDSELHLLPTTEALTRLFIRVQSAFGSYLPLRIRTSAQFLHATQQRSLALGFFFGIIAALGIYQFFLFALLQERIRLFFAIHILALGLYFVCLSMLYEWRVPLEFESALRLRLAFLVVVLVAATQLARTFLLTRQGMPNLDKALLTLLVLVAGLLFVLPFLSLQALTHSLIILSMCCAGVFLAVGVLSLLRGFRPARFFVISWSTFFLFAGLAALMYLGVLSPNPWTMHGLQIGTCLQALLMSMALSDRARALRDATRAGDDPLNTYQQLVGTDALTGLLNQPRFEQCLLPLLNDVDKSRALTLLLLEIDNYSTFCRQNGSRAGKNILVRMSQLLQQSTHGADLISRNHQYRFAVALPATTLSQALGVAERIRAGFGEKCTVKGKQIRLTVSLGCAQASLEDNISVLSARAEKMLGKAQHYGGDCVYCELNEMTTSDSQDQ